MVYLPIRFGPPIRPFWLPKNWNLFSSLSRSCACSVFYIPFQMVKNLVWMGCPGNFLCITGSTLVPFFFVWPNSSLQGIFRPLCFVVLLTSFIKRVRRIPLKINELFHRFSATVLLTFKVNSQSSCLITCYTYDVIIFLEGPSVLDSVLPLSEDFAFIWNERPNLNNAPSFHLATRLSLLPLTSITYHTSAERQPREFLVSFSRPLALQYSLGAAWLIILTRVLWSRLISFLSLLRTRWL